MKQDLLCQAPLGFLSKQSEQNLQLCIKDLDMLATLVIDPTTQAPKSEPECPVHPPRSLSFAAKMAEKNELKIPETFVSFTQKWHSEPYEAISPSRPALSAAGKNVVVTGGGTGIGKAIAIAFAQAGASSVSILGRREDRLITASKAITEAASSNKTLVLYRVTDLADSSNVKNSLQSIVDEVGRIAILVSNAGALPEPGPLATHDVEVFMSGFELNVRSALNAVQAFLPLAIPDDPVLINISTAATHLGPMPGMSSYSVSKAANHKMMDYLAFENPGLYLVNVQPGVVKTEINADIDIEGRDARKLEQGPRPSWAEI